MKALTAQISETELTKVGQVHDLPAELVPHTRVHLTGTITYYDSAEGIMFLQDATGGVYVTTTKPYPVHIGDLVMLQGFAQAGYRTEVAPDPDIEVIGRGTKFPALDFSYRELVQGLGDCKMVTIRGIVRARTLSNTRKSRPRRYISISPCRTERYRFTFTPPAGSGQNRCWMRRSRSRASPVEHLTPRSSLPASFCMLPNRNPFE